MLETERERIDKKRKRQDGKYAQRREGLAELGTVCLESKVGQRQIPVKWVFGRVPNNLVVGVYPQIAFFMMEMPDQSRERRNPGLDEYQTPSRLENSFTLLQELANVLKVVEDIHPNHVAQRNRLEW